jgi:hypothetical protein
MPRYKMIALTSDAERYPPSYFVIDNERQPPATDGHNVVVPFCQCFTEGDAMQIADALNKADL